MKPGNVDFLKNFLNKCKIVFDDFHQLNNMIIPREILLDSELYKSLETDIIELKKIFNSSYLTALQSNAKDNQKWPLLNLVRQILKSCYYNLTPKRLADGYEKGGKKKFKRVFIITKINQTLSSPSNGNVSSEDGGAEDVVSTDALDVSATNDISSSAIEDDSGSIVGSSNVSTI